MNDLSEDAAARLGSLRMYRRKRAIVVWFIAANFLFWVYFWLDLSGRLVSYQPHPPAFEEILPAYVFEGWGLPLEEWNARPLQLARMIQAPCFWITHPITWAVNKRPHLWDKTFLRIAPHGYRFIAIMILSFGQWYLVARAVAGLLARRQGSQ